MKKERLLELAGIQLDEEFDHDGGDLAPLAKKVAGVLRKRVDAYVADLPADEKAELSTPKAMSRYKEEIAQEQGELFADMMYEAMGGPW